MTAASRLPLPSSTSTSRGDIRGSETPIEILVLELDSIGSPPEQEQEIVCELELDSSELKSEPESDSGLLDGIGFVDGIKLWDGIKIPWNWISLVKEDKKDMNSDEKAGEGNSIKANRRADLRNRGG